MKKILHTLFAALLIVGTLPLTVPAEESPVAENAVESPETGTSFGQFTGIAVVLPIVAVAAIAGVVILRKTSGKKK